MVPRRRRMFGFDILPNVGRVVGPSAAIGEEHALASSFIESEAGLAALRSVGSCPGIPLRISLSTRAIRWELEHPGDHLLLRDRCFAVDRGSDDQVVGGIINGRNDSCRPAL